MAEAEKVTEEQANLAFQELTGDGDEPGAGSVTEERTEAPQDEVPAETESAAETEEVAQEEVEQDDLESLRKRFDEAQVEAERRDKAAQARVEAMQQRFSQNEGILRKRFLEKSTVTDKLVRALEKAKTEEGLDPAAVDQLIGEARGTMNPASTSFAEPQQPTLSQEDQAIVLNNFLNERLMDEVDADEFGKWLRGDASTQLSPIEQAVAGRDLDGFLRIAHNRFREGEAERNKASQRNDAVEAVKSVQRTQKAAARAASTTTSSPKKQPSGAGNEVDTGKLTKADISTLLRQSVNQYR